MKCKILFLYVTIEMFLEIIRKQIIASTTAFSRLFSEYLAKRFNSRSTAKDYPLTPQ
jgi:hypothetical protein